MTVYGERWRANVRVRPGRPVPVPERKLPVVFEMPQAPRECAICASRDMMPLPSDLCRGHWRVMFGRVF